MTKELLSLCIQVFALAIVCLFSKTARSRRAKIIFAVILMFFVNIGAQIIIAGEGPGACVGFVGLPILGVMVAMITDSFAQKNKGNHTPGETNES